MSMAAESTRWWSNESCGNSFSNSSVTTLRQSREVARTFALSIEWIANGGLACIARWAASLAIRWTSATLYVHSSLATLASPPSGENEVASVRSPK